jgi:large subunit ribosomal protein L29
LELSELRQMSAGDLGVKQREAREEVFRLRLKLRTSQLDNSATLRKARRELAQILTVLREKTPGAAGAGARKDSDAGAN